jgi:arylsulfatase A-like enzyme
MNRRLFRATVLIGLALLATPVGADPGPVKKGPTVLLVTIDTIRADRLSCYGYGRRTTPVIDRLTSESGQCREAVTTVPLTTPSHASIFTGLHPRSHAVLGNSWQLAGTFQTLAEQFRNAGYRTAAFVSAVVLDPRCGLDQGFDHYSAVDRRQPGTHLRAGRPGSGDDAEEARHRMGGRQRRGDETVDLVLAWMDSQRGAAPLFVWVHLYDPHQPYDPPEPYRQLFGPDRGDRNLSTVLRPGFDEFERRHQAGGSPDLDDVVPGQPQSRSRNRGPVLSAASLTPSERERVNELYDGEVALADFQVGRLLAWLKGRGLYDGSVVAVMGDHGEVLGEHHDYFGHHHMLYDGSLRIPLVIRVPGGVNRVLSPVAATYDLAPTLLKAAGLALPAGLDGRDLFSGQGERPYYCETYLGIRPVPENAGFNSRSDETGRRPAMRETGQRTHRFAVRDGRWKLVFGGGQQDSPMLFDLQTDPGERSDVAGSHKTRYRELSARWQKWCDAHGLPKRNRDRPSTPAVDEEMRDKLRQLGYVE